MPVNTITAQFSVSGPLDQNAINDLAATGTTLLINVRPDNEGAGQTNDTALAEMAEKAGLAYAFIPVTSGDYPDDKIASFANDERPTDIRHPQIRKRGHNAQSKARLPMVD